ncbi:MAG: hypothetical protein Q9228_002596 [Teloschistes exilis]
MTSDIPTRPRVFLDVQSGSEFLGRIIIELFSDKTPKTCENFRSICTSSPTPTSSAKRLTYKDSPFHRIIDEFMIQGGDITAGNGTGGASIYGRNFEDENLGWRMIDAVGLVCMANIGKGTNSSQFFITLAPCEHLNGKHTVFGHVVKGMDVCERMAKVPVDKKDRPLTEVIISHCGELERRPKQGLAAPLRSKEPNGEQHLVQEKKVRAARRSNSPSDTRSPESPSRAPSKRPRHLERSTSPRRRRSDTGLDENRRGRTSTRSQCSDDGPSQSPARSRHHRKRSSPPSPRHGGAKQSHRPSWEDHRKRGQGPLDRRRDRYQSSYDSKSGNHLSDESRGKMLLGHNGDGRLGAEDRFDGSGVQFKGRGSMKYREPKQ